MTAPSTREPAVDEDGVLARFLGDLVVNDYDVARPAEPGSGPLTARMAAVVVMAMIGLLIVAAVVSARAGDAEREQTAQALSARIQTLTDDVSARRDTVDARAAEVDELRRGLLDSAAAQADTARLQRLAGQAGTAEMAGPGLIVTIDDAPDAEQGSLNRVLDRDLQDIVNTLWRMGAVGVDVNGQRLSGLTAIRGAGEAILVNYQPLTRPYVVSAIGVRTAAGDDTGLTGLLAGLTADYGLVTDVRTGDVALPAGELRAPRFAHGVDEGAAS